MIVMGGLYFYDQIGAKSNESGIEYIQSFIASSGNLVDYQNKLGMKDPATDLKWYKTDDEVRIDFGRIILKYSLEEFMSEKVQGDLASIGITSQVMFYTYIILVKKYNAGYISLCKLIFVDRN